ncbi:Dabb family protein [Nocardioidaceae bacterium]|nr:Dabb family protein [Nocardioidaceae bacterium]
MIRNVVLCRLPDDASPDVRDRLDLALDGIASLDLPGMLANHVGPDAGLREGGWTAAITNDWTDEAAYRGYDTDVEHNRHRSVIVEVCEQVARVQLDLPDEPGR